jgi:hypothetical protein
MITYDDQNMTILTNPGAPYGLERVVLYKSCLSLEPPHRDSDAIHDRRSESELVAAVRRHYGYGHPQTWSGGRANLQNLPRLTPNE